MNLAAIRRLSLVGAAVLLAVPAVAHPGHALTEHGVVHWATSPFHIATLAGTGVVFGVGSLLVRRPAFQRALATCGFVFVAAAVVFRALGA